MPAPLKITLTQEEDDILKELSQARFVPKRTSERARMLRLNAQGWKVSEIAKIGNVLNLWVVFLKSGQSIHWDVSYPHIQNTTALHPTFRSSEQKKR